MTVKTIKDILQRDPTSQLVNQGQARLVDDNEERALKELQGELKSFVCEGQYADGIIKIIRSTLDNLGHTSQRNAWVSGFYGSGKSHLLKMLAHLWQDTIFPDGSTARGLVPVMPEELTALLKELDTAGRRAGGLFAAAGAMPSGHVEAVRLSVLRVLLRGAGLPEQYAQASFCLWLIREGKYELVRQAVEAAGRDFMRELNRLYVSRDIAQALIAADLGFHDEESARNALRAQFPAHPAHVDLSSTDAFLEVVREVLALRGKNGRMPLTLLVLDEVQQYIGDSERRSTEVTEVAEAVAKQLDSHVIIVGAGQSALSNVPLLHKMMDRFTIRVPLSDAEIETVTRKVLLGKRPDALSDLRDRLERHSGEISRQLQGSRIGERAEDRESLIADYPLLPVRRRFWDECFRQIDTTGTQSQLRSQLRIINDALAGIADCPLGTVVSGDELFTALSPEMVNLGTLPREVDEMIRKLRHDMGAQGELAARVCGVIFLISLLRRPDIPDIGIRAARDHIADLLITDLNADNGKLRAEVEDILQRLLDDGKLMLVGSEFRLQTREGAEWDREFRNRQTRVKNDEATIHLIRDRLLQMEIERALKPVKFIQGAAKEQRLFALHRDTSAPPLATTAIPLWVRDGWGCPPSVMQEAARAAGTDSPVVFVHIARLHADALKQHIIEAEAAERTLDAKGAPTLDEGKEARRGMETRLVRAQEARDRLIRDIVAAATVYQGGGNEVYALTLEDKLRDVGNDALVRLFPRFKDADHGAWEAALRAALQGAELPLSAVGWTAATENHVVCTELLAQIGAGKTGTEIRRLFGASPYGWPQDAVDAVLVVLHRSQHLSATLNGAALTPGQLDRAKIPKADFRRERTTLGVSERLALRRLFAELDIRCGAEELAARAPDFLRALRGLGLRAGGEPPLPMSPSQALAEIDGWERLVGNEQLAALHVDLERIREFIVRWAAQAELAAQRRPGWVLALRLASHAEALPDAANYRSQLDAIREQRLLLENVDPVASIRQALAGLLREAVIAAQTAVENAVDAGFQTLGAAADWASLTEEQRRTILTEVGLAKPARADVSTDQALAESLDHRSLASLSMEADAVSGRVQRALEKAAALLEPEVRLLRLPSATLRTEADLDGWLERVKTQIAEQMRHGPVLVR
jgi:hypothetical protein